MNSLLRRSFAPCGWAALSVCVGIFLTACGGTPVNRAPVDDRSVAQTHSAAAVAASAPIAGVKQPPGFENAGRPGYYTVKPGDTLIRIGLENGQSHKDLARWNALDNPNKIEVGQVLRVVPPVAGDPTAVAVAKPVASGSVVSTPLSGGSTSANAGNASGQVGGSSGGASAPSKAAATPVPTATPVASAAAVPPAVTSASAANTSSANTGAATGSVAAASAVQVATAAPGAGNAATGEDELSWIWPGKGAVIAEFSESKNKGVDIAGNAGDAVVAAADGKVVYAGAGLRGYGNLIILKHNNTYLSAYAHNQALLVKEDQSVKKGQKIAEMGNSDADRVKLHFEIRRQGKPVDPQKYLPNK